MESAGADLSDDLRNAMTRIIDEDIRDSASHIDHSAKQMDERISAISLMAKHGRRNLQPERLDLGPLVAEVCAEHEMTLKKIGGEVEISELPEIEIDKMSVQLIAENVVANAVKYSAETRPLRIKISADIEPDGVMIRFQDNGRGISSDDLSRVFVMFRRVGKQDTQGDGTGLAFSRAIANRLGGRIWCESTPGQGSTFHVYLPSAPIPTKRSAAGG